MEDMAGGGEEMFEGARAQGNACGTAMGKGGRECREGEASAGPQERKAFKLA